MNEFVKLGLQAVCYFITLATLVCYSTAPDWIRLVTLFGGMVYFTITYVIDEEDKNK